MTDQVTIKLHYKRADEAYTGWNAWVWTMNQGGSQYELAEEDGEMVATITVNSPAHSYVSFILRKGAWQEQEFGERRIDLSKVLSGTVHYHVTSGVEACVETMGKDAVVGAKLLSANYNYETGRIRVETSMCVDGDPMQAFALTGDAAITEVAAQGCVYTLTLDKKLDLVRLYRYKIRFQNRDYAIGTLGLYACKQFAADHTYSGSDLGAVWSETSTTFKVWAPTAEKVQVALYESGTAGTGDLIRKIPMKRGDKGVWSATAEGDLNGIYYTYLVTVNGGETEAVDPYARTTGVNGNRGMVLDLASTNPQGWDQDISPNKGMAYTDAIVYELHVRDFSIDESSGVSEAHRGKFLALTETGTKTPGGTPTGLDYLKNLGITHLQLLPIYDYISVDESRFSQDDYSWGYDPQNFNVPEGSYSTDATNGRVRVAELKQAIKALHDSGINVVMDVVYNHVADSGNFCFNKIVPGYFSRTNADGSYSNGSGCGNDTASERAMVRKYIVDSVCYWAEEYHIDGFRFDLVGLLDAQTINELVDAVHAKRPEVIFYGEGWSLGTAAEPGTVMATQVNSSQTPNFGYFNDTLRDLLAGRNGSTTGVVSGRKGQEETLSYCFKGDSYWCGSPTQTVNYVSCHDNYTLMDKLYISRPDLNKATLIEMGKLAAAIYMTAQGIPFIHAGEEFLRKKLDKNGKRVENSYNSPDFVNKLRWDCLEDKTCAAVAEYYKGLVELRKNHAALRLTAPAAVKEAVSYRWITNELVVFNIKGKQSVKGEVADGIVVIFNATPGHKSVNLYSAGVDVGTWKICVDERHAGTAVLDTVTDGRITMAPLSAMVLIKGCTVDDASLYPTSGQRKLGGKTAPTPVISPAYPSLSFEDTIRYNIHFTISNMPGVGPQDMGLITFGGKLENGTIEDAVEVNAGAVSVAGEYVARTGCIPAKEMGDTLYFKIYARLPDGSYVYSGLLSYSAVAYAKEVMASSDCQKKQHLVKALLNYGTAAQEYFDYKTDAPMNAGLTDD